MSQGAMTRIQRVAIGKEASLYATPASFTNPRGIEGTSMTAAREALADNRQLTSRKGQHAAHIGQKSFTFGMTIPMHDNIVDDIGDVFEGALGSKVAASGLTFVSGTQSTITISAGVFDPLIIITLDDGSKHVRPVKSVAGGTVATLAIQLPALAGRTVTDVDNAGACYKHDPSADILSFEIQTDRDQETDQVPFVGKGCAPLSVGLSLDLTQRLGFSLSFEGGDWLQQVGGDLGDPDGALTGQYLGYACEVYLQSTASPSAGVQIEAQTVALDLAPQTIGRRATRINTSVDNVPGSSLVGWKRGLQFPEPVTMTLTLADAQYITDRNNRAPFGMLLVFSKGTPDSVSVGGRVAVYLPRVVLDAEPTLTDIDGIEGMQLSFRVEEEGLLPPYLYQGCISFFS
jgi:hypothetical protein